MPDDHNHEGHPGSAYWKAVFVDRDKVMCVETNRLWKRVKIHDDFHIVIATPPYNSTFDNLYVEGDASQRIKKYLQHNVHATIANGQDPPAPPPGLGLIERGLGWAMPSKVYKRVIAETIADFKQEYAEAHSADQPWRARWFLVLGYLAILRALAAQLLSILELIRKLSS